MLYKTVLHCILAVSMSLLSQAYIIAAQPAGIVKWIVEKNSTIRVRGKTNVSSFSCNVNEYAKKDTLIFINDPVKPISFTGEIQMDILSFNCHSSMITKGLRKTLKADEYPVMSIRFISLQSMPLLQNKMESVKGWVEVDLAGVVKRFELSYSFVPKGSAYILLNGQRSFRFSDFNLSPPQKFGGLIKINDDFDVDFSLLLRPI